MGVDSWCFCKGVGKSEKMKGAIFTSKSSAIAHVGGALSGTGFLIHRNLLVTTHGNLNSVASAEASEIRLRDGVAASLFPHRFFITSSVLDLTIVGLDVMDGDSNAQGGQPHYLKTCAKPNLELGSVVYLLGYAEKDELELVVGEGKVVIATDNLIKLSSTDGLNFRPGSAGFDAQGNLAFMICDPMKLASSLNNSSSMSTTTSSISSVKKDTTLQFGIPVPVICDWLNQHWEGNLDEVSKPKLPLMRLRSTGHKSEHSCASFTMRRVFKSTEAENDGTPSSSNAISKARDLMGTNCLNGTINAIQDETRPTERPPGIPTPEIYESRKLTSVPVRKRDTTPVQLLDINFPPRKVKNLAPSPHQENPAPPLNNCSTAGQAKERQADISNVAEAISSKGSVNEALSEVQSCSSEANIQQNNYSSEGETMYSAETAESRNYTSPREVHFQQIGRSQSCVNYNRWGRGTTRTAQRTPSASKSMLEKHKSFTQGRKVYSQGTTSQRSNDYFSPTVSSIMKKRNNAEQMQSKPRPSAAVVHLHSSPKWNF